MHVENTMFERQLRNRLVIVVGLLAVPATELAESQILVGHEATDLEAVPTFWTKRAIDKLHIVYNFTCPGSQIISGMEALASFPPYGDKYAWSDDGSVGLDLDIGGIPCEIFDLGQGDYLDERWRDTMGLMHSQLLEFS